MMYVVNGLEITADMMMSTLLLLFLILNGYLLYRNYRVFKERGKMREIIFKKDENDDYIYSITEIFEIVLELEKNSSYFQMLFKIWIPVKTFYIDFIEKIEDGKLGENKKC